MVGMAHLTPILVVILPQSTESFGCNPQAQREAVVRLLFSMKNGVTMPPLRRLLQKQTRLKTTSRTPSFRQPNGGLGKLVRGATLG